MRKSIRRSKRRAFAALRAVLIALLAGALSVGPSAAGAAPQRASAAPVSAEVSDLNLARVAASAEEIQAVLKEDAGLLIELKRWVALEASEKGQILEDQDLQEENLLARLEQDLEFRSVATRLLQRYGYLLPQLNPDSEAAKEAELVREERARLLARAQLEVTEAPQGSIADTRAGAPASARRPSHTRPAQPESYPPRTVPHRQPPGEMRTAMPQGLPPGGADRTLPVETVTQETDATLRAQRLVPASLGPQGWPGGAYPGAPGAVVPGGPQQGPGSEMAGPRTLWDTEAPAGVFQPEQPPAAYRQPRETRAGVRAEAFEELVRRPNPYADIPSLYDMYQQVAARPEKLERFGAAVFANGIYDPTLLPMDLPVGPDYVVGPGDGLTIDLWGSVSARLARTVDPEGRLSLPEVGPVLVSGRTLGEVQRSVEQMLRTQFREVSTDVSLTRLRTIRVYVVGDVEHPGAYDISSLSTPLNALFAAGGPTERGSLRRVRHLRADRLLQEVDLYDLLLRGVRGDLARLENGDTVLVPPPGGQVTVEGAVRRPAVYELGREQTLAEVLELAGGILPTAALRRIEVQRVEAHEKRTMLSVEVAEDTPLDAVRQKLESFTVQDGDEVRIFPIAPYNEDAVYLAGHVLRPGKYSYREGMRLTDVVSSYADLLPEPAAQYAEIVRLRAPDFRPSVESFDLGAALADPAAAPRLEPLDTVRIFSRYDFEEVPAVSVGGEVYRGGVYRASGQIRLRDAVHLAGGLTPDAALDYAQVFRRLPDSKLKILSVHLGKALAGDPVENILLQPRDRVLVHSNPAKVDPPSVYIKGEVAKPGRYPLTTHMRVAELLHLAGGLKRSAYAEAADLTSFLGNGTPSGEHKEVSIAEALAGDPAHNLVLRDGDTLTVRQIPGWGDIGAQVTLRGEVAHPGVYGIAPGERLSSVLKRAGGFRESAYPPAAVLQRRDVRELQQRSKQELIQRIQADASNVRVSLEASGQEQAALQQAALAQRERVLESLRQAPVSGRLVVTLQRDMEAFEGTADDIEMRNGDVLVVPKRPDFVVVTGQVYNSNAITYQPRKNAAWYLRQAGGTTDLAESDAIFIIRANGSVVSAGGGWWSRNVLSTRVLPGDTIVIPEKAIGQSTFWKNFLTVAQVTSQTAISAAILTR